MSHTTLVMISREYVVHPTSRLNRHSWCWGSTPWTAIPMRSRRCTAVRPASGWSSANGKTVMMRFRHGPWPAELPWHTSEMP
eukprot:6675613-Prymnesium_polylepis.1